MTVAGGQPAGMPITMVAAIVGHPTSTVSQVGRGSIVGGHFPHYAADAAAADGGGPNQPSKVITHPPRHAAVDGGLSRRLSEEKL